MKKITVFCGSNSGAEDLYIEQATALGRKLAQEKIGLVYGGAKIGLMGAVAYGVLSGGGEAIGVIPRFLRRKEIAHDGLTELILVESMHERKTLMNDLCDGVIALPGGFGTLEELFEMITWSQLGLHEKPIALFNIDGYYDQLLQFLDTMVERGFLKPEHRNQILVSSNLDNLLEQMKNYDPPEALKVTKWIDKDHL